MEYVTGSQDQAIDHVDKDNESSNSGVVTDVIDRRQREKLSSHYERTYEQLFRKSIISLLVIDRHGKYLLSSEKASEHFGLQTDDIVGKSLFDLLPNEVAQEYFEKNALLIDSGGSREYEDTIVLNGKKKTFRVSDQCIQDENGSNYAVLSSFVEITDTKKAEDSLKIERDRLASILEGTKAGTWEWDVQTGETSFSKRWAQIIGYTLEEISPVSIETWRRHVHHECLERSDANLRQVFDKELDYYDVECRMKHKDGSFVWVHTRGKVTSWTPEGKPLVMRGTHTDITERKQTEAALKASEEKWRTLFSILPVGISIHNEQGKQVEFNQALGNMLAIDIEGLRQEKYENRSYFHADGSPMHPTEFPNVLAVKEQRIIRNVEIGIRKENDEIVWTRVSAAPMCLSGTSCVVTISDITEMKQGELALIASKKEAEEANAAKSQFLSNMSHEIRTPMNGFIGMIQLLELSELSMEQRELLRIAKTSANALLFLINNILDFSKIEAGKMQLENVIFNTRSQIGDTINIYKLSAEHVGLHMETSIEKEVPDNLIGDPFRLRQILSNLIGNAIKFTKEGGIDISIKKVATLNKKEVKLEFAVRDTGIGIPMNKIDVLFHRFSQVDAMNTHAYAGTGLGLAICKGLVEKMGGEIWVESVEGKGSSFFFTCVMEKTSVEVGSAEPTTAKQTDAQKELSILLVENDSISRTVMKHLSKRKGWKVTAADNGDVGCDIFKKEKFDIVLMDVQMPNMNGFEATRNIRMVEGVNGYHTPIIAMTAYALKGDREKCLEAGMDDYIPKPIDANVFYTMVEKWTKTVFEQ